MKKILNILLLSTFLLYGEGSVVTESKVDTWGIEFNPLRLLVYDEDETSLSGTFSYFDNKNSAEIAVPWLYYKNSYSSEDFSNFHAYTNELLTIDLHYRKYFLPNTEGAYVGVFGRYAHLDGEAEVLGKYATVDKFGLGFEVGFKVKNFFDSPFYYGASIAFGGYVSDNNVFTSNTWFSPFDFDDKRRIVDVELFKIGYEF